jgi:succinylglutamic semialdehyde dehydrogenase
MKYSMKGNFYQNNWSDQKALSKPDRFIEKSSPANLDQKLYQLPVLSSDVDGVLDSAFKGFSQWKLTSFEERFNCLRKFQDNVKKISDEMAVAIALETGKPLWEAKTEVAAVIAKVDTTIEKSVPRITDKSFSNIMPNTEGKLLFKPIGPTLVIGPFNFPCHLANGQLVSSLLAGNSVIFKPSEKTAYSGQLLIECYSNAGFPSGVINLIQGDGDIARRLIKSKLIKGIYFTGSKDVGLSILKDTYTDLSKLVALELGGKNSSILHKDANLGMAMVELLKACFLTAGQRCISTSIIPIHRSLKDEFIEKFHQHAKALIIDHPIEFDKEPFMGPLVDQRAMENYLLFMGMAKREKIEEVMRGKQLDKQFKGYYVSPSIHLCSKWDSKSVFLASEIFGPNVTFIPYDEIEEAVAITNSTEYGLASSVFTSDQGVYDYCWKNIDCGQVNLNKSTVGASSALPFGGVKNSGNYRPAAVAMIDSCVYQMASLCMNSESWKLSDSLVPGLNFKV